MITAVLLTAGGEPDEMPLSVQAFYLKMPF